MAKLASEQQPESQKFQINYNPAKTLKQFNLSSAFYRGVLGPVGSGKSTSCCMELLRRAMEQITSPKDKIRRTRFTIVRNTYGELRDTTIPTWLYWFPETTSDGKRLFGPFHWTNFEHFIKFGDVEMEVLFRALDKPDDVKKVLSMEVTGAWINEAREVPYSIVSAIGDRVGRFPSISDGGCSWSGVIMDTNPPDSDHWWPILADRDQSTKHGADLLNTVSQSEDLMRAAGLLADDKRLFDFFAQPGGLLETGLDADGRPIFEPNPEAENLDNLEPGYYIKRMAGKSASHIRVYYCARYGFSFDGKPIIPEYREQAHASSAQLRPMRDIAIQWGVDFGLTPAAMLGQKGLTGRWTWLDELVSEDMGAERFAEIFCDFVNEKFAGCRFADGTGDPAGEQRAQTNEQTPFQIFNKVLETRGMPIRLYPAITNDFTIRREAIAHCLNRMIDGMPGMIVSSRCPTARKGLKGGYCYKRLKVSGDDRYHEKPDKNKFSHVVEAGGYMMLGAGEGVSLIRSAEPEEPLIAIAAPRGKSKIGGY